MSASPRPPLRSRQRKLRLGTGVLMLLLLVVIVVLPRISGSGSGSGFRPGFRLPSLAPCAWHSLTGLPCPLCGGTRAACALLQGDFQRATRLNPLAFPAVGILVLLAAICFWEALRGRTLWDWAWLGRHLRLGIILFVLGLMLWWGPHLWRALRDPSGELLDLRNPIARKLHGAVQAGSD